MKYVGIGIGPGIGLSTAEKFAREGYEVVITSRDQSRLNQLAESILKSSGRKVETYVLDPQNSKEIEKLAKAHGASTTVVHYNAAAMRSSVISDTSLELLEQDVAVNLVGALATTKLFSAYMKENKSGSILLTGGGFALYPSAEYLTISLGKAAIRAMTEALFPVFAKFGVHIATVTILKNVAPDSPEAKAAADSFWNLHKETKDAWTWEAVLK